MPKPVPSLAMALLTATSVTPVIAASAAQPPAGFVGEFWDVASVSNLDAALDVMGRLAPTATFVASALDYPGGAASIVSDATRLDAFLGLDAATLSGAGERGLEGSIFRFSGMIDLGAGVHEFAVGSDDGFQLRIGGDVVGVFADQRAFATTVFSASLADGPQPFELVYFENFGVTGVDLRIDGALADRAILAVSPVPEPVQLPLYLAGLAILGRSARRRQR
ncbi:MAG: hypothetical protein KDG55_13625 [Rhodocyclaceae bacterium]|nr:hypothetical protein [Rhodocyclaceae bacterium]